MIDDAVEVDRWTAQYVAVTRERVVVVEGKEVKVTEAVTIAKPVLVKTKLTAKECKFFVVAKEGKLEALDVKKAAAMLKKPTAVLTGDSAEVDPRNLEVVKPGTIYLVIPAPTVKAGGESLPDKRGCD
jgi:hypothetical protein